jgi:hypothetical protein
MPELRLSHARRRTDIEQEARMRVTERVKATPRNLERIQNRPELPLYDVVRA